jgi:uncharacterized protein (DUF849 family)
MIVQACINGARPSAFHPRLPLDVEAMVRDSLLATAAGAAELHVHPRADGRESLAAIDETVLALRRACPGTFIGVSTGAWIEGDEAETRRRISEWRELPDYASVNLSEPDAPAVMALLRKKGVGIEAGLASVADAERLLSLPDHTRVLRILIEIDEQDVARAMAVADGIATTLASAGLRRSVLLHGSDATVWPFVVKARERGWSTRVGLEDGKHLPDGTVAEDNAALVSAAVAIFRAVPSAG